jgi:hypothetical protein
MMKPKIFLSTLVSFSISGSFVSPVLAQYTVPSSSQNTQQFITSQQSTAIVVGFPNAVEFVIAEEQSYPTTLLLVQPIVDAYGSSIVPANSSVQAKLVPVDDGVQLVVEALVVGGQTIPVQASSPVIPSESIRASNSIDRVRQTAPIFSRLGGSVSGAIDGNTRRIEQGALIGNAVGILAGLAGSSNRIEAVHIPQGSTYVLTLQSPLVLAGEQVEQSSAIQVQSPSVATANGPSVMAIPQSFATQDEFGFQNVLQYTESLEQVIAAYQHGELSIDQARSTIEAADRFATAQLDQPLYPLAGIRQQVTQLFGYIYAIDR